MSAAVIIPARYGSTRFPGKPLATLMGKPLIGHVHDRALGARSIDRVIVATDSEEIARVVREAGGEAVMTSSAHLSGTDRVAEAALAIDADIIVNVQGDEPLIRPEAIDQVVALLDDPRADMSTLATAVATDEEARSPHAVKVVLDREGFALYFSRAPIPYHRDLWPGPGDASLAGGARLLKHVGIYGYRREALLRLAALAQTELEGVEKLEQLRAIEHGMRIKVGLTEYEFIGVDTPEDMERVEKWLSTSL
jgi:3-deoxy-manno-octulosonate cytidylyltransferase (CMP-KDO synthetase)